jgi:hypothetical protein
MVLSEPMNYIIIVLLVLVLIFILMRCKKSNENYTNTQMSVYNGNYEPGDYISMSHLPFDNPIFRGGRDALGYIQYLRKLEEYPPRQFFYADIPVSCPPNGVRVYETGNAQNPNVQSGFGPVDLDYVLY